MGCFYFGSDAYQAARDNFQSALNACVALSRKQEADKQALQDGGIEADDVDTTDTDALVTTISYNLARTYEALDERKEAQTVYEGLLKRHPDYTEASARLAFIALQDSPQEQGPRQVRAAYEADSGNTEMRAMMGWYYHRSKRRTMNIAEDSENRHYKHTLQGYDKHDNYSLTGMGNIHIMIARDMPRTNDSEKEKRSKMYVKAFEFFDKALQLDPKNAYAAQGIAIALCDDKKNYSEALQILTRVKDTIRDISVYVNLGHVYAEIRQFQRSIDNYRIALHREGGDECKNAQLLACMSRVCLLKGKTEKSISGLNESLTFMRRALATQPDSPHLQFNVAFIQFQMVQMVNSLPEADRTLEDVNVAKEGLEEAIATFESVAKAPNPPYPRTALEQRAAMSKGTMRKQIERTQQQQADYERNNKDKLEQANLRRASEQKRREEAVKAKLEAESEKQRKMQEERQEVLKKTEELSEKMRAEALAREAAEYTDDEETGERVKRAPKKKKAGGKSSKKRDRDDDGFIEDDEVEGASERSVSRTSLSGASDVENTGGRKSREKSREPKKKRRKLERKSGAAPAASKEKPGKYKSAAVVVDSDSDQEPDAVETPPETPNAGADDGDVDPDVDMKTAGEEEDEDEVRSKPQRKRKQLRTIADDEDEDE